MNIHMESPAQSDLGRQYPGNQSETCCNSVAALYITCKPASRYLQKNRCIASPADNRHHTSDTLPNAAPDLHARTRDEKGSNTGGGECPKSIAALTVLSILFQIISLVFSNSSWFRVQGSIGFKRSITVVAGQSTSGPAQDHQDCAGSHDWLRR